MSSTTRTRIVQLYSWRENPVEELITKAEFIRFLGLMVTADFPVFNFPVFNNEIHLLSSALLSIYQPLDVNDQLGWHLYELQHPRSSFETAFMITNQNGLYVFWPGYVEDVFWRTLGCTNEIFFEEVMSATYRDLEL